MGRLAKASATRITVKKKGEKRKKRLWGILTPNLYLPRWVRRVKNPTANCVAL